MAGSPKPTDSLLAVAPCQALSLVPKASSAVLRKGSETQGCNDRQALRNSPRAPTQKNNMNSTHEVLQRTRRCRFGFYISLFSILAVASITLLWIPLKRSSSAQLVQYGYIERTSEVSFIHAQWRAQIQKELEQWDLRSTKLSETEFLNFEQHAVASRFYGSRVVIKDGQVHFKILTADPNPHAGHTLGYTFANLVAFKNLLGFADVNNWTLPAQGVALHVQYGDGCTEMDQSDHSVPVFGYNNALEGGSELLRRCRFTVTLPTYDWYWPGQDFLPGSAKRMDVAKKTPWSEKKEVLLFRGNLNSWDGSRVAILWSSLQHPGLIDGKLTQLHPDSCDRIRSFHPRPSVNFSEDCTDFVGDLKSPSQFSTYKYWLDVDGHGATFRYKNYLHGDSVIFKVESEYYQYFHPELKPWVHFIPVNKADFADSIVKAVSWARENDAECKEMVQRTKTWAKRFLTHAQTAWYQKEVLTELSLRYAFTPSLDGLETICCSDFDRARHLNFWGQPGYSCVDILPCTSTVTTEKLKLFHSAR